MMGWLQDRYLGFVAWVFEGALQPAMYALGLMEWAEDAFDWLDFVIFGVVQVAVVYLVCRPLEAWRPVERGQSAAAIRTDVLYTLLSRLGILPLLGFVVFAAGQTRIDAWLTDTGWVPPTIESFLPWLREAPLVSLAFYLVVIDFFEYWRHRFQHEWRWWWSLHSLHHAQAHMTFWTDDRNHVLDDVIAAVWVAGLAVLIGVPPGQFPIILMVLRLAESLSHANARISFGRFGERLLVSPRFHRLHHGVLSVGATGRNYAVLLPVWDWMFGTADFRRGEYAATGDPQAPDSYVRGSWLRQQWAGLGKVARAVIRR